MVSVAWCGLLSAVLRSLGSWKFSNSHIFYVSMLDCKFSYLSYYLIFDHVIKLLFYIVFKCNWGFSRCVNMWMYVFVDR